MRTKVYDMPDQEFEEFQCNLTLDILEQLDPEEFDELDPDFVREAIELEDFEEMEDQIHYKDKYNVPLGEEEEDFIRWENGLNGDLGPPLM